MHSQHNLLLPGRMVVESRGYDDTLRKGDCFALTILNMQVLTTLLVAQAGGTSIVMDRIDAEGVAEWIRDERVTTFNGPPALLHSLAHDDAIAAADLASLDEVWTGGADCPEAIRARLRGQVRPARARHVRTDRSADDRVDRPARRPARRPRQR